MIHRAGWYLASFAVAVALAGSAAAQTAAPPPPPAAPADAEAAEKARLAQEAELRARIEAELRAKIEAEVRARLEAEARAKQEAEEAEKARLAREAEERQRLAREAEERQRLAREAEERERLAREAEEKARLARETEEKNRLEAEARARREAEERTRREAEERTRREAQEAARQALARAAIAACDKGAAAPLDPTATAPPVRFDSIGFEADQKSFDQYRATRARLADDCAAALLAEPDMPRIRLQHARVLVAQGGALAKAAAPTIRAFARQGAPEAQFLVYHLADLVDGAPDDVADAIDNLRRAAEAGHLDALELLAKRLFDGGSLRRDIREAARFARLWAAAPPQGPHGAGHDAAQTRTEALWAEAAIVLNHDGFSPEDYQRAFAFVAERTTDDPQSLTRTYLTALRFGRGTDKRPADARARAEKAFAAGNWRIAAAFADMLARGEGGPADYPRALDILRNEEARYAPNRALVLADLLLDPKLTGPRPREAAAILAPDAKSDVDAALRLAGLLRLYPVRVADAKEIAAALARAARVGEPGAAMAFARLAVSGHRDFSDVKTASALLVPLHRAGDHDASLMLAGLQYANLGDTSSRPSRRASDMNDAEIRAVVEAGIGRNQAAAHALLGKLVRKGLLYPQDDGVATRALIKATELGDAEAAFLASKAYDDGIGVAKNVRERVRFLRVAAKAGHGDAMDRLASVFLFKERAAPTTLREYVSVPVALYSHGLTFFYRRDSGAVSVPSGVTSSFNSFSVREIGARALAAAVLDGFRLAPEGLTDEVLAPLGREIPADVMTEIGRILQRDGALKGEPERFFGVQMRAALVAWVQAKGPLPEEGAQPAPATPVAAAIPAPAVAPAPAGDPTAIPDDVLRRAKEKAGASLAAIRNDRDRANVARMYLALARYGDLDARFFLLRTYHTSRPVRQAVGAEEMARWAIGLMFSGDRKFEKFDIEFLFTVTNMAMERKAAGFARGFLDALRDDSRLHEPRHFAQLWEKMSFAPSDLCGAAIAEARRLKITTVSGDDCRSEDLRDALIAWAKAQGPAGVDAKARAAAAVEVRKLGS